MKMKQWTTLTDGIDNLKLETTPVPAKLKEDEVLAKINCVSLNNYDLQRVALRFPIPILSLNLIIGAFKNRSDSMKNAIVTCSDASGTAVHVGRPMAGSYLKKDD
ncbi:hypothetical protein F4859DRAFT_508199 [Xylaria cf. heliscus]|nr:hypothetical protein F4859DRAFT_508199 [Xylaria cf. heliscus]